MSLPGMPLTWHWDAAATRRLLKTPESITYYGGKSQQVEKNTRVKARVKAHALREIIAGKDQVLIMGHRMADVDSFGSAVGIYRIAQALDRKAHIVLNDVYHIRLQPLVDLFKNNPEYDSDMIVGSSSGNGDCRQQCRSGCGGCEPSVHYRVSGVASVYVSPLWCWTITGRAPIPLKTRHFLMWSRMRPRPVRWFRKFCSTRADNIKIHVPKRQTACIPVS